MINLEELIELNLQVTNVVNQLSVVLLILILGFIIGKLVEKLILLLIRSSSIRKIKIFSFRLNPEKILPVLFSYIIYLLSIFIVLSYSGLLKIVIAILVVVFVVAVLVSIFSAIKESFPNLSASIRLKRNKNFRLRKKIEIDGLVGEIAEVNSMEVRIATEEGDEIHIPCKLFLNKQYKILE
jgi:hypothetical protein